MNSANTTMTRKAFKEAKVAQQRTEKVNQYKQVAKKTVVISGMLVTLLTYTFANGSVLEVQAKGQEVINTTMTVEKGHTLSQIAQLTGTTVEALKTANHLSTDRINVGQKLILPKEANIIATLTHTEETKQPTTVASTYVVQAGDTLTKIAKKTGVSMEQLREANHLIADLIFEGETLSLKPSTTTTTIPSQPVKPTPPVGSKPSAQQTTHIVQSGENLYRIAQTYGLTVTELKALNGLQSDELRVNMTLIVSKTDSDAVKKPIANTMIPLPAIVYTVKAGDTMYQLEQLFDLGRDEIMEWNNKQYANLIIGERIMIYGEAYQALATINGAVDNHSIEVTIGSEEKVLQLNYNEASYYAQSIGKKQSIQWINTPTGKEILVNVK